MANFLLSEAVIGSLLSGQDIYSYLHDFNITIISFSKRNSLWAIWLSPWFPFSTINNYPFASDKAIALIEIQNYSLQTI